MNNQGKPLYYNYLDNKDSSNQNTPQESHKNQSQSEHEHQNIELTIEAEKSTTNEENTHDMSSQTIKNTPSKYGDENPRVMYKDPLESMQVSVSEKIRYNNKEERDYLIESGSDLSDTHSESSEENRGEGGVKTSSYINNNDIANKNGNGNDIKYTTNTQNLKIDSYLCPTHLKKIFVDLRR